MMTCRLKAGVMRRKNRDSIYKAEKMLRVRASQLTLDIQTGKRILESKTRTPMFTRTVVNNPKPKSKLSCG
jgi:hypothetical protein